MPPPATQQMGKQVVAAAASSSVLHQKIWMPLAKHIFDRCSPLERTQLTNDNQLISSTSTTDGTHADAVSDASLQQQQQLKLENENLLDRLRQETRAHSQERSKLWEKIESANSATARAKQATMKISAMPTTATPQPIAAPLAEEAVTTATTQPSAIAATITHPIFGRLLCDLGSKRVYETSPSQLCDRTALPVWDEQRVFNIDRAKTIAKAKAKDQQFGFPGVISVFEHVDEVSGELKACGIVDGQHRVAGLEFLLKDGSWPEHQTIALEVFPVNSQEDVRKLFIEINQAEPVRALDLPGAMAANEREAINDVVQALVKDFGKHFFKPSSRCRVPHLHVDNLRESLADSPVARSHAADSTQALREWVMKCNSELEARSEEDWKAYNKARGSSKTKSFPDALAKCKRHGFYLGLDSTWLSLD